MMREVWFKSFRVKGGRRYQLLEHVESPDHPSLYKVEPLRERYAFRPDERGFDCYECWFVDEVTGDSRLVADLESLAEVLEWLEHGTVI